VNITNAIAKSLLLKIFSSSYQEDNREALLLHLLAQEGEYALPKEFKESLLPLCRAFSFTAADEKIRLATKKYDSSIKETILNGGDPFPFIEEMSEDPTAHDGLKTAIISNASLLILKDVSRLITILRNSFPELYPSLIQNVRESATQNYFLKTIRDTDKSISVPKEKEEQYLEFICKHYPEDVRGFLIEISPELSRENTYSSYIAMCEKYSILDGCAFLSSFIGDIPVFSKYITNFLTQSLIIYLKNSRIKQNNDQNNDQSTDQMSDQNNYQEKNEEKWLYNFHFVISLVEKPFKRLNKGPELKPLAQNLIKAFVLPLYGMEKSNRELNIISNSFKELCILSSNVISFNELIQYVIIEFAGLKVGSTKDALITIVNDFSYDVDMKRSLSSLIRDDEINTNNLYLQNIIKGVAIESCICEKCRRRLVGCATQIRIFPCGHIFHESCFSGEKCSICFANNQLGQNEEQEQVPKIAISNRAVTRLLTRFEKQVQKSIGTELGTTFYGDEQKKQITISPIAKLPPATDN